MTQIERFLQEEGYPDRVITARHINGELTEITLSEVIDHYFDWVVEQGELSPEDDEDDEMEDYAKYANSIY